MTSFSIFTLGCKVNTFESEFYRQSMIDAGFSEVMPKEPSDIVIINTCTVTNTASFKSRQRIHQAKRLNPKAFVVVVGCYAQTAHAELKEKYDIDLIVGAKFKNELVKLILQKTQSVDYAYPTRFESMELQTYAHQKRAYVKIQDGCNQFCSYCIIPFARGRERSLAFDSVLQQVKAFNQHHEIVLTGIHTGRYGHDIGRSLVELIQAILKETTIERIRISSIEMTEIGDDLIELMRSEPRLARHLHIPLQSAHDELLKAMNRPYTLKDYASRLQHIRACLPDVHVSTDIIVGFPGETESHFESMVTHLEAMNFGFMHIFPYSMRKNTAAEKMTDTVNGELKKARVHRLQALNDRLQRAHLETLVGKELEVLIEDRENGYLFGYSKNYEPVRVQGEDSLINQLIRCTVKSAHLDYVSADIL